MLLHYGCQQVRNFMGRFPSDLTSNEELLSLLEKEKTTPKGSRALIGSVSLICLHGIVSNGVSRTKLLIFILILRRTNFSDKVKNFFWVLNVSGYDARSGAWQVLEDVCGKNLIVSQGISSDVCSLSYRRLLMVFRIV
jgi:hypothetical protein